MTVFPGPWDITGENLKISGGYLNTGDYNNPSGEIDTDNPSKIDAFNT